MFRDRCMETVVIGLHHDLMRLSDTDKPADCWAKYLELLQEPCDPAIGYAACISIRAAAASEVFNWCAGATQDEEIARASPEWHAPPELIASDELQYELSVVTQNPEVDAVRFWAVHRTGEGDNESSVAYSIGEASVIGEFGARRVWRHEGHRGGWDGIGELRPFGLHDRVVIVAQALREGEAVGASHVVAQIK